MSAIRSLPEDIVINANQPKSNLLRVLFERQSHISDSVTYDIMAWSVLFVYGVQAYGLNAYVPGDGGGATSGAAGAGGSAGWGTRLIPDTAYGYAIRWTGIR